MPYPLLCDPGATLIGAIGLKKAPKGTTRGVFVIDKSGKVLAAEPGGPDATVNVVTKLVEELGASETDAPVAEDEKPLPTAAEVEADVAASTAAAADEAEKEEDDNPAAADEEKTEDVNGETDKEETEKKE